MLISWRVYLSIFLYPVLFWVPFGPSSTSCREAGSYHSHRTFRRIDTVEIARGAPQQLSFLNEIRIVIIG